MTKLEQVARALFDKASEDRPIYDRVSWDELGPMGREHFMGLARAVVEVLRDADFRMNNGELIEHHPLEGPFRLLWEMTIDAILSEKPE